MAAIVVNQGLQRIATTTSVIGGGAAVGASQTVTRYVMTMAVDDNASAFAAAHTNLLSAGSITNEWDQLLDGLATLSGQAATHVATIATGNGNFTIKRFSLHDDTATNVTTSSTTLCAGVDGQSFTKTSSMTLAPSMVLTYSQMADRWQTGETRRASLWFATTADAPATGLTPTVTARRVSDGVVQAAPTVTEVGSGFYSFAFTAPSNDAFVFLVDGGASLDAAHRYVPMEIPVGGYVDSIDAAITTRATPADVSVTVTSTPSGVVS